MVRHHRCGSNCAHVSKTGLTVGKQLEANRSRGIMIPQGELLWYRDEDDNLEIDLTSITVYLRDSVQHPKCYSRQLQRWRATMDAP